jgi:hypothetical protein
MVKQNVFFLTVVCKECAEWQRLSSLHSVVRILSTLIRVFASLFAKSEWVSGQRPDKSQLHDTPDYLWKRRVMSMLAHPVFSPRSEASSGERSPASQGIP